MLEKIKEKSKNKKALIVLGVIGILISIIGLSYAFFTASISGSGESFSVTTASLGIVYTSTDSIIGDGIMPGWSETKTFTVKNISTSPAYYTIIWTDVVNTFVDKADLVYSLSCVSDVGGNTCNGVSQTIFPSSEDTIITNILIDPNELHTYSLSVTFINQSYAQDVNQGVMLAGRIEIREDGFEPSLALVDSGIDYSEITDTFYNPERGWTSSVGVTCLNTGTVAGNPTVSAVDNITARLIEFDIKDFGASTSYPTGRDFSPSMLAALETTAANARNNGVMMIVRFAYDYEGDTDAFGHYYEFEPPISRILTHIGQLEPFFSNNADGIMMVQVGFLGPWGENHGTTMGESLTYSNQVIEELLSVVPESIPISIRTPERFASYLNINLLDIADYTSAPQTDAYRIGIYNDSLFASCDDNGTFKYLNSLDCVPARTRQLAWIHKQSFHTYYGGETNYNSSSTPSHNLTPQGTAWHDISHVSKEMFDTHLTYLSSGWTPLVHADWNTTTYQGSSAVDAIYYGLSSRLYIGNRMGYRFVIRDSKLTGTVNQGDNFSLNAKVENVGAANIIKEKEVSLLLVKGGVVKHTEVLALDARTWLSRTNWDEPGGIANIVANVNIPSNFEIGTYEVYLKIANPGSTHSRYSIRFANADVWSESLGANYMGTFNVSDGTISIETTALPDGRVGKTYNQKIDIFGGDSPYTFSATGLPSGLSINSSGIITGTPSASGTFSVSITVTDANSLVDTVVLPLRVGLEVDAVVTTAGELTTALSAAALSDMEYLIKFGNGISLSSSAQVYGNVVFTADSPITLNTASTRIYVYGTLTMENNITVYQPSGGSPDRTVSLADNATLNVYGGKIQSDLASSETYVIGANGVNNKVNIVGGTIISSGSSGRAIYGSATDLTVTLRDATITSANYAFYRGIYYLYGTTTYTGSVYTSSTTLYDYRD